MTLDLVIIRGAPGVGKSTLGKGLLRALPGRAVIEVDQVRSMIAGVDWTDPVAHYVAIEAGLAVSTTFLVGGVGPVFLIDTFAGSRRLDDVVSRLGRAGRGVVVWSLVIDEPEHVERLRARTSGWKDLASSRAANTEIRRHRFPRDTLIDVTDLTPDQVLQTCLDLLRREGLHPEKPATGSPA